MRADLRACAKPIGWTVGAKRVCRDAAKQPPAPVQVRSTLWSISRVQPEGALIHPARSPGAVSREPVERHFIRLVLSGIVHLEYRACRSAAPGANTAANRGEHPEGHKGAAPTAVFGHKENAGLSRAWPRAHHERNKPAFPYGYFFCSSSQVSLSSSSARRALNGLTRNSRRSASNSLRKSATILASTSSKVCCLAARFSSSRIM